MRRCLPKEPLGGLVRAMVGATVSASGPPPPHTLLSGHVHTAPDGRHPPHTPPHGAVVAPHTAGIAGPGSQGALFSAPAPAVLMPGEHPG